MSIDIVGKRLALIIWGKDRNGEDEVWVHTGTVQASDSGLGLKRGDNATAGQIASRMAATDQACDRRCSIDTWRSRNLPVAHHHTPEGLDPSEFEDIGLHHPSDSD